MPTLSEISPSHSVHRTREDLCLFHARMSHCSPPCTLANARELWGCLLHTFESLPLVFPESAYTKSCSVCMCAVYSSLQALLFVYTCAHISSLSCARSECRSAQQTVSPSQRQAFKVSLPHIFVDAFACSLLSLLLSHISPL
jgi:hypothetical protein